MKVRNIVPRAGIKPASLVFWLSMLPLHHVGSLSHQYTHAYLSMQLLASEVSADYYTRPPGVVSLLMLTVTYIQAMNYLTFTYTGYVQQPYSVYLIQNPSHDTSVVGVMKIGNIVPRAGIKPTSRHSGSVC